jgi:hypothetical protein
MLFRGIPTTRLHGNGTFLIESARFVLLEFLSSKDIASTIPSPTVWKIHSVKTGL